MARLFPLRSETPAPEGQPRVVDLEDEDADAVFSALSSTTAREIYTQLSHEPGTPSDVAEAVDSSIQNVRYHLEKLENAGLVEVIDTWYSSRGNEMSVYATADGPLIVTSDQSKAAQLKTALSRFLGGVAALAGGSLLVQYGLEQFFSPPADDSAPATAEGDPREDDVAASEPADDEPEPDERELDEEASDDAPEDEPDVEMDEEPEQDTADSEIGLTEVEEDEEASDDALDQDEEPEAEPESEPADDTAADAVDDSDTTTYDGPPDDGNITNETVTEGAPEAAEAIFATIPPGLLFFLGGLAVLIAVTVYWYWGASY